MFKGTAITEHLSKKRWCSRCWALWQKLPADKRSGRTLTVIISIWTGDVNKNDVKKKRDESSLFSFPPPTSLPVSLIDWLTDLYCHGSTADSDLHTYITLYVLGWMAAACVNSAWGRCPRVCVSQITFTRRCSSRLPAPAPSRYHIKRIWMWLNSVTGETVGARHAWLMSSLQH